MAGALGGTAGQGRLWHVVAGASHGVKASSCLHARLVLHCVHQQSGFGRANLDFWPSLRVEKAYTTWCPLLSPRFIDKGCVSRRAPTACRKSLETPDFFAKLVFSVAVICSRATQ